jgi:uncharacterized protein involved in exopolysaccharide biosynthesis
MSESSIKAPEVSVGEFLNKVKKDWWILLLSVTVFSIGFVVLALKLPNIYKSDILLQPIAENDSGLLGMGGQLGGLASIAGINLSGGDVDKTELALATLKSRTFVTTFVNEHKLKKELFAADSWQQSSDEIVFDDELYDIKNDKWVRDVSLPKKPEPSLLEVYKVFIEDILEVEKDKETGFVRISVKHVSPTFAQKLVTKLFEQLDSNLRYQDEIEATKSIEFLEELLADTKNAELQTTVFGLIEQQYQKKMLTKARENYVFKVIDKAVVAEEKHSPKRALICIFGFLLGACFGVVVIFFRALK